MLCNAKGDYKNEQKSTFVPAKDLSKLWRAIIEFDMLQPGDRILCLAPAAARTACLTAMLAEIKNIRLFPSDLACYTVNGMFAPNFPKAELEGFLRAVRPYTLQ